MREHSAIDYSKPILDWLENSKDDALEKWDCIIAGFDLVLDIFTVTRGIASI
ncbi:Hypothetical predicted protein [Olea europaea subsp. europaea]|uniref:Uncharacterized protein n=1 Tax=Olea europaea subsp. europaea TaxID=158383 RepID=A0A8S0PAK8_OLEEU|nr:Hypothetical predicted protein [Olea europaea subsp. europaea]